MRPEYKLATEIEERPKKRTEYLLLLLFFIFGDLIVWMLLTTCPQLQKPEPVPELRQDPETRALHERRHGNDD